MLERLNGQMRETQQGIPYAEQVAMMRKVSEQERTIGSQQVQITQMKKEQ